MKTPAVKRLALPWISEKASFTSWLALDGFGSWVWISLDAPFLCKTSIGMTFYMVTRIGLQIAYCLLYDVQLDLHGKDYQKWDYTNKNL